MAEKIFRETFCEITKIKVCTTTAEMNFDNYTEPGAYEIYEDMGNGQNRLYLLTVDRSASGDCVTQTRMYCGKIEYRQADGSGKWGAWKGIESGEGGSAQVEQLEQTVAMLSMDVSAIGAATTDNITRISNLESNFGEIDDALDGIIAIQNSLIGGDGE